MGQLKREHGVRRRVPVGDMHHQVFLEDRTIKAPQFGDVDAEISFGAIDEAAWVWAKIETLSGKTYFDDVSGAERLLTHMVVIRRVDGVSAETWVRLPTGDRLDIADTEDYDERGEFIALLCVARGKITKEASVW